jgi:hypothetical protein
MFLHLGSDVAVALSSVIYIGDCKTFSTGTNREFLLKAAKNKKIVDVAYKQPKSYVVTEDKIYLSAIASTTLKKRAENIFYNEEFEFFK